MVKRTVSVGQTVKAMILNGIGFANRALYLSPIFFKDKPTERLIGAGIQPEHINDDILGRALDTIFDYDPSKLFLQCAIKDINILKFVTTYPKNKIATLSICNT
ncbi:hypothetical protein TI04_08340 [Achromatium sp. WMS2]|nr:hypothetical protein TI04_08340 [Achromatium sp. WMS2]